MIRYLLALLLVLCAAPAWADTVTVNDTAAARTAVPALVAEVRRLREYIASLPSLKVFDEKGNAIAATVEITKAEY